MQLLSELVKIFAAEYPELLLTIDAASRDRDADTLRKASHKLKGSLLQFSAPVAANAAGLLEHLAASNSLTNIAPSIETVRAEIDRVMQLLETMIPRAEARANKAGES
jgi:HPt (histidine-containing phosphotransfer) domain-containing protein